MTDRTGEPVKHGLRVFMHMPVPFAVRVGDAVLMQIFMRVFHRNSPRAFFVRIISRQHGKIHRNINNFS